MIPTRFLLDRYNHREIKLTSGSLTPRRWRMGCSHLLSFIYCSKGGSDIAWLYVPKLLFLQRVLHMSWASTVMSCPLIHVSFEGGSKSAYDITEHYKTVMASARDDVNKIQILYYCYIRSKPQTKTCSWNNYYANWL